MFKQTIPGLITFITVMGVALTPFTSTSADVRKKPEATEETVVTGVAMETPLALETDPKAPRQPLPAQDGADFLKTLPGFSVVRKGGTSGDPVFRGMAGSRLSLLLDGDLVLGGCGSRMDPPTAYVFPETYDRIRLIKGPQSVLYGPGNSAGVVLFERDRERMSEPGWEFHGSLLAGSFGRDDQVLDVQGGTPDFYLRGLASHSQQDNYSDGDGTKIHSQYSRWNTGLAMGWTPDDNTTLELSGNLSDAEAAYADRGMDGSRFPRENLSLKWIQQDLKPWWSKLETQVYYNYVDHVMDNHTLRIPPDMPMASNPDRETEGARIVATLVSGASSELVIGMDTQANAHSNRSTMNQMTTPYQYQARVPDAEFEQFGIFIEWTQTLALQQRVIAGMRIDDWRAKDLRATRSTGMTVVPNPTAWLERKETLSGGFLRYEKDVQPLTLYIGIGQSERFPDYWELITKEALDSLSAFNSNPETTTQLDLGTIYHKGNVKSSVSVFYSDIDDFLLIQSGVRKPAGMIGTRSTVVTRNIDARTWGMEADLSYNFTHNWRAQASLASVRGSNETDGTYLAQLSPLELRVGLHYNNATWSGGMLWRAVADQERVDPGKGSIVGQDIGPSDSFNVLSLNVGWRPSEKYLLTGGVDNLLDETYDEHISRAGAMVAGFEQTTRVNEPGLTGWIKFSIIFL